MAARKQSSVSALLDDKSFVDQEALRYNLAILTDAITLHTRQLRDMRKRHKQLLSYLIPDTDSPVEPNS